MIPFVLRRLARAVPLLLAISLLAFALGSLGGRSSFDRYRADERHDPATVRRIEREARLDRTFLVRWLHWLRGVCFDLRIERRRKPIAGFEEEDFEARLGVERFGLASVQATADDSTELRRAGRLVLPAGSAGVRLRTPLDLAGARGLAMSVRNPGQVVRRLEASFEAGTRRTTSWLDVEPGPWREWETPAAEVEARLGTARVESVLFSAPGTGEFLVDDLSLVESGWDFHVGAPDFGWSFERDAPVWTLLRSALGNSILLAASALLFTWAVAIPAGILAALHPNRLLGRTFSALGVFGRAVPNFFLLLLALVFLVALAGGGETLLPLRGALSEDHASLSFPGKFLDRALHLLLPMLVLSAGAIAGLARIARGGLLEDHAHGCPESRVVYGHALRHAVNPLLSVLGKQFASLLSGLAICEILFGYPGVGRLLFDATIRRDPNVVMAGVTAGAAFLVFGRLLAGLLLRAIDSRFEVGARGEEGSGRSDPTES
ncbi:MAG TPA: ABC transporter permease subunit [Planctomycetota bacterium]|nr:ABC transporter permease subunit [Planctomycetota bacterium]